MMTYMEKEDMILKLAARLQSEGASYNEAREWAEEWLENLKETATDCLTIGETCIG